MCAYGRGDAVGVRQRDRVVERARAYGASGDGVAVERGDQGELVATRGSVAVGECVDGLGELVHVRAGAVGAGGGIFDGGGVR